MRVLGLSFSGHGTSVCLVEDGRIVRALNLERITRKKFSLTTLPSYTDFLRNITCKLYRGEPQQYFDFYEVFPQMLDYVCGTSRPQDAALDLVVKTRDNISPIPEFGRGPMWEDYSRFLDYFSGIPLAFDVEHHLAHAYQAYLCSPFEDAALLTVDGCGESLPRLGGDSVSTSFAYGTKRRVRIFREIRFPYSIGGLYSSVTRHLGFRENQEGNTMALAAFGTNRFYKRVRDLFFLESDGGYRFQFGAQNKTLKILDVVEECVPSRVPGDSISQAHKDIAYAAQRITEEIVVNAARGLHVKIKHRQLAIAGGVGLNCVANARILAETDFREIYTMPNAGDRGLAAGCALYGCHVVFDGDKRHPPRDDYLGRAYSEEEMRDAIGAQAGVSCHRSQHIAGEVAELIANGAIVGWFQGAAEFGPRALGHRSILADPRTNASKQRLDNEIKRREWFRPYAPSVLREKVSQWFSGAAESPYMLLALQVRRSARKRIPGIVHVDGSARVHTVDPTVEPLFYKLIKEFETRTGVPLVLNTSFNSNGAPIVETPEDALNALNEMKLDALAIGPYLVWRDLTLKGETDEAVEVTAFL